MKSPATGLFAALLLSCAMPATSSALAQTTSSQAAAQPASQPAIAVTHVKPGPRGSDGMVTGTVVEFDLVSPDLKAALKGASTRLKIDIDCGGEKIRALEMAVFEASRQAGQSHPVNIKSDWESYRGGAYLADVARSICASNGGAGGAAKLAKADGDPSAKAAATGAEPAPAAGRIAIQFISSPSERDVNAAIAKVRERLAADIGDRTLAVESASVRGKSRYRGRLSGFSTAVEAEAFCSKIIELNLPCIAVAAARR
jgi:hypothetical protein